MIEFIKGEDRHVMFRVHSAKGGIMVVDHASYVFSKYGEEEDAGECEIIEDKAQKDVILDMKLEPKTVGLYLLEITYQVVDETLKHREEVKVI